MKANKKLCLISINSYNELTGGGVYLRTLVNFVLKQNIALTLIDKKNEFKNYEDENFNHISFSKSRFTDIVSRLFLLPSFYTPYLFSIAKICKGHDIIAFHNSRLGIILYILKFLLPNKKIILFTDNFELDLLSQKNNTLTSLLERTLVKLNECLALKYADLVSYITHHDKKNMDLYYGFEKNEHLIIPVTFIRNACQNKFSQEFLEKIKILQTDPRKKIIFTASFDFFPNIDAAKKIVLKALENPDLIFILAGRKVNTLKLQSLDNIFCFDSLSNDEMAKLLSESDIFYSPLVLGSGMKTKVAEALSYGLYIYASEHTMIGYDEVICDNNIVATITDIREPFPDYIKKKLINKVYIKSIHKKYYSYERFLGNELDSLLI